MNLDQEVRTLQDIHENLRNRIRLILEDLPDNPKITRSPDGKTFVMSFSDLPPDEPWAAFYYDFKAQYNFLIERLEVKPVELFINELKHDVIKTRKLTVRGTAYRFNPTVCNHLVAAFFQEDDHV